MTDEYKKEVATAEDIKAAIFSGIDGAIEIIKGGLSGAVVSFEYRGMTCTVSIKPSEVQQ